MNRSQRSFKFAPTRVTLLLAILAVLVVSFPPIPVGLVTWLFLAIAIMVLIDVIFASFAPKVIRLAPKTTVRGVKDDIKISVDPNYSSTVTIRQQTPYDIGVEPEMLKTRNFEGQLISRSRGTHILPRVAVRLSGPLRLATVDHLAGQATTVSIFPDLPGARRLQELRRRGRLHSEEGKMLGRLGLGTELETIRDYMPDDDIRQVNWKVTARVGKPMSNVYRVEDNRLVICMIDTGRLMSAPIGIANRLDIALDAMAYVAVAAEDSGDRVGVIAFSDRILRNLEPRRKGADAVVRTVYELKPELVEPDYELAFQMVANKRRSMIILFTDILDEASARALSAAVTVIKKRHSIMVVSSRDPDIDKIIQVRSTRPIDAFRQVVALDYLESRQRAINLLRAQGVKVIQGDPYNLARSAQQAYLSLRLRS
ncbi:MAG: DUF58 domain-containing protein [Acidimicrobiales bacterium]|nr:DUF58 domain-containing protein [Acidimicrobiales bacterium]